MKWFKNRKISTKLILSFLILAVLAAAIGIYGIISLNSLGSTSTQMITGHGDAATHMGNLKATYFEQSSLINKILAEASNDTELIPDDIAAIKASDASMMESLTFLTSSSTEATKDMMNKVTKQIEAYRTFRDNVTDTVSAGDITAVITLLASDDAAGDTGIRGATKNVIEEFKEFDSNFAKRHDCECTGGHEYECNHHDRYCGFGYYLVNHTKLAVYTQHWRSDVLV